MNSFDGESRHGQRTEQQRLSGEQVHKTLVGRHELALLALNQGKIQAIVNPDPGL